MKIQVAGRLHGEYSAPTEVTLEEAIAVWRQCRSNAVYQDTLCIYCESEEERDAVDAALDSTSAHEVTP